MSDADIPCIGICQTDEFGYCIGCGRRAEDFPAPAPAPAATQPLPSPKGAATPPVAERERDAGGAS